MSAFGWKGSSGFSARSTAEQVTQGVDASVLTAIVTGATSGIGTETARVLALRGVRVVMAARNTKAGGDVKEAIIEQIPTAKIDVMELDLSSMASVRNFASQFISMGLPLNILINNAGVLILESKVSKDNIELNFATNHLGHFLLTNLLLETMKKTVQETNKEGRIINISSSIHHCFKEIHFNETSYNKWMSYKGSKLANILHANELSRRLKEDGVEITANSLHPGMIYTNIFCKTCCFGINVSDILIMAAKPFLKTIQQGAATTCYLALNPQVKGISGQYFVDCNIAKASSNAMNPQLAKQLWDYSLSLTNEN